MKYTGTITLSFEDVKVKDRDALQTKVDTEMPTWVDIDEIDIEYEEDEDDDLRRKFDEAKWEERYYGQNN